MIFFTHGSSVTCFSMQTRWKSIKYNSSDRTASFLKSRFHFSTFSTVGLCCWITLRWWCQECHALLHPSLSAFVVLVQFWVPVTDIVGSLSCTFFWHFWLCVLLGLTRHSLLCLWHDLIWRDMSSPHENALGLAWKSIIHFSQLNWHLYISEISCKLKSWGPPCLSY